MIKFKIGDIITAYRKGIHEITNIERRFYKTQNDIPSIYPSAVIGDEFSPLIYYRTLLTDNGTVSKQSKTIHCCDQAFCSSFENFMKLEEERLQRFRDNLNEIKNK